MNITILSASPKKRFSTSMYYARIMKSFLLGHSVNIIDLKTIKNYNEFVKNIENIDALIIDYPLYVDAIPSTLLYYLEKMEKELNCKRTIKVYAINGCGFYEGKQCKLSLQILENWTNHMGFEWCGGVGIGAGEMLNIIRIMIPVGIVVTLIEILVHLCTITMTGGNIGQFFSTYLPINLIIQAVLFLLFSSGMFIALARLSRSIKKRKKTKNIFTTVWFCPRFLFVIFASIYWVVRALLCHGVPIWKLFRKREEKDSSQ